MKTVYFKISLFVAVSLLLCCNSSTDKVYIISKEDSIAKKKYIRRDGIVIMPPSILYGEYNFIVDSNNNFYYYQLQQEATKGITGDDEGYQNRSLAYLNRYLPFKIPHGLEKEFFEANISKNNNNLPYQNIVVASAKDTIVSDFIPFLRQCQKDSLSRLKITFRKFFREEQIVLRTKIMSID